MKINILISNTYIKSKLKVNYYIIYVYVFCMYFHVRARVNQIGLLSVYSTNYQ